MITRTARSTARAVTPWLGGVVCLSLLACAGPDPTRHTVASPDYEPGQRLEGRALLDQAELAELVVVGSVRKKHDEPGGVVYEVRIDEVLRAPLEGGVTDGLVHPHAVGELIRVSAFWFQDRGPSSQIGPVEELSRYMFFLAPAEAAGEWFNLQDAAIYGMPEAQESRDALRAVRDRES
jgi:hypothetical protein